VLIAFLNDLQAGSAYGEYALEALAKSESKALAAKTLTYVYSFVFPWTKPLREMFKPLMKGHDAGLRTGDTESLGWAALKNLLQLRLYAGTCLDELAVNFEQLSSQMKAMKLNLAYTFMQPVHQAVLNLTGIDNVNDPTSPVGKVLSQDEFDACFLDRFYKPLLCIHECLLLTYFGKHERHAQLLADMGPNYVVEALPSAPENMINTFVNGLSSFTAARETGQKRYAKLGTLCRDRIKKWKKQGNPNVIHYDMFLGAEYHALKGTKRSDVVKMYNSRAIRTSLDGDFIQDAALACKRLGEFQMTVSPCNMNEGYRQIRKAAEYWMTSWGAVGKVRDLEGKYPKAFDGF